MDNKFRNLLDKIPEERCEKIKDHTRRLINEVLRRNPHLSSSIKDCSFLNPNTAQQSLCAPGQTRKPYHRTK